MAPAFAFHDDPEKAAEDYLMERMPINQVAAYQRHLACCPACAQEVEITEAMIDAFRELAAVRKGLA